MFFLPKVVELYFWIASIMIGNFVVYGEHWGKLPWSERFESPLKLFAWLLALIIIALVVTDLASPIVQDWLSSNVDYLTGITSGVIGTFYVWFIWSGDWDFTTDYKWVPPVVCYGMTLLNIYLNH